MPHESIPATILLRASFFCVSIFPRALSSRRFPPCLRRFLTAPIVFSRGKAAEAKPKETPEWRRGPRDETRDAAGVEPTSREPEGGFLEGSFVFKLERERCLAAGLFSSRK